MASRTALEDPDALWVIQGGPSAPRASLGLGMMPPGTLVALLSRSVEDSLEGRLHGLELRDTLLVLRAGAAVSFVFLFRMPLKVGTVDTLEQTGTGGLNIAASRVGASGGTRRRRQAPYPQHTGGREDRSRVWARSGNGQESINAGRWPPNVVLVHGGGCQGEGCSPDCPVALLDAQSGERPAGCDVPGAGTRTTGYRGGWSGKAPWHGYGDAGGPSRFYPQFANDLELHAWVSRLLG